LWHGHSHLVCALINIAVASRSILSLEFGFLLYVPDFNALTRNNFIQASLRNTIQPMAMAYLHAAISRVFHRSRLNVIQRIRVDITSEILLSGSNHYRIHPVALCMCTAIYFAALGHHAWGYSFGMGHHGYAAASGAHKNTYQGVACQRKDKVLSFAPMDVFMAWK
jgi:hypothetical protein